MIDVTCPLCWGLGSVIREDSRGRVYEWACIYDCPPPLICVLVNKRRKAMP